MHDREFRQTRQVPLLFDCGHKRVVFRVITLSYPEQGRKGVRTAGFRIKISSGMSTIYETVSYFAREAFPKLKNELTHTKASEKVRLGDIVNIHNDDGIKNIEQIRKMTRAIESGKHIFSLGIPNVKLVKTKAKELLLFDGPHSMLAYMNAEKKYLEEIPHMIIEDEDKGYIDDKDIVVFYGEHAKAIRNHEWKEYVINWQAVKEKRLCRRVQRDMGELFCAIKSRIKSS